MFSSFYLFLCVSEGSLYVCTSCIHITFNRWWNFFTHPGPPNHKQTRKPEGKEGQFSRKNANPHPVVLSFNFCWMLSVCILCDHPNTLRDVMCSIHSSFIQLTILLGKKQVVSRIIPKELKGGTQHAGKFSIFKISWAFFTVSSPFLASMNVQRIVFVWKNLFGFV